VRNFERLEAPNPSELHPTRDRSEVAAKIGEIAVGSSVETGEQTSSFWELDEGSGTTATEQIQRSASFWEPLGNTALHGAEVTHEVRPG
jgi:hypothetical protein